MVISSQHEQNSSNPEKKEKDPKYYSPLYKAAIQGDWETAKQFFKSDPEAIVARISISLHTTLHIAAVSGQTSFVEELVQLMPPDALALKEKSGFTALHSAATSGNTLGAKAMVNKNPDLPQIRNSVAETPLVRAAKIGHRDLLCYLYSVTRDEDPSPFRGQDGVELLRALIAAEFYDVALNLVKRYPQLATTTDRFNQSALYALARKSSAFKSGSELQFWQRCIYSCIHVEQVSTVYHRTRGDKESPPKISKDYTQIVQVLQRFNKLFWNATKQLVPSIKQVYDTKFMHTQALELIKFICSQVSLLDTQLEMDKLLLVPIMVAAEYGNVDVITTCIETDPNQIWTAYTRTSVRQTSILHIAIQHRQENVFNLIRRIGPLNNVLAPFIDKEGNSILHQAAKLGPASKLNAVSGAALQVQREIQWYKEVEKIVQPTYRELVNFKGERPKVLFTGNHQDLIEKGEMWMKDMASSSMIVATLIATVVFAAAFTVPGGNNGDSGMPNFLKAKSFMIFAISNALALFSSLTSVLIFLSILTSRYAEEDFVKSLPQKLIIGLSMLLFSIVAMMMTFSATYFIMLGHQLARISLLLALLACAPVTVFAWLQLPLFVEVILSTYGSDVFNR